MTSIPKPAGRVAIAGFQHETNTFAPMYAPYEEFVKADGWPGLTIGDDIFKVMPGKNLPLAGFLEPAIEAGYQIIPILWCAAEPSSYVSQDAFERISGMICDGLSRAGKLDAVYLDLHGAMVTERYQDGEGELLARVREIIGPDIPLIASLDLHANVTRQMTDLADGLTVFRTYPHVDMAATGERAFRLLERRIQHGAVSHQSRALPFLLPLTAQCTNFEPCKSIYEGLSDLQKSGVWNVDFAAGFPLADIAECGPVVYACGDNPSAVAEAVSRVYESVMCAEKAFDFALMQPDDAVRLAMSVADEKPVVLADVQDNPGAGGTSDTTGLLTALVANKAQRAVVAILNDPSVARAALSARRGDALSLTLGGKSGQPGQVPYSAEFVVEYATQEKFLCSGTMYRGMIADIGPLALLKVNDPDSDVRVIVSSVRMQCLDLAVFGHMGIDPEAQKILAVKSTVHFREEFDRIASRILPVEAPGANPCRLLDLDYKNLRRGVRLEPMGPEFA